MARTILVHENMSEVGVVRANEVNHGARSSGIIGILFRSF